MNLLKGIANFFSGNTTSMIENIATEWIETSQEKAEAQAVMVKALDPNGKMRRKQSNNVGSMYKFYLLATAFMLFMELFYSIYMGEVLQATDPVIIALSNTTDKMTTLFTPITTLYGVIVTASFGVNYANAKNGS